MKFDDQLAAYLYEYKSLRLEGIGTFTLDEKVRVPNEQEKEVYYPIDGLAFIYNPKSATEENVIFFLIKKLRKIEPLIRSDLESYLYNIRVLLNIGSPYTIHGIGTLNKNNQGIYEFTPGAFLPAKEELNPKRENADHNYPVRSKSSAGRVMVIILIVISAIAAVSGIAWAIFNFTQKQFVSGESAQQQVPVRPIAQQSDITVLKKDTAAIQAGTSPAPLPSATAKAIVNTGDSVTYKMVFEVTKSKERAHSRTAQLNNLHSFTQYDSIPINDSVAYYSLFLRMKINPADSIHVKDSLQKFFGKKIFMEKQVEPQRR